MILKNGDFKEPEIKFFTEAIAHVENLRTFAHSFADIRSYIYRFQRRMTCCITVLTKVIVNRQLNKQCLGQSVFADHQFTSVKTIILIQC